MTYAEEYLRKLFYLLGGKCEDMIRMYVTEEVASERERCRSIAARHLEDSAHCGSEDCVANIVAEIRSGQPPDPSKGGAKK